MISGYPLRFWWLGASAALVSVGSLGPWARALFVSVSGVDGDGKVTLALGVAAVVVAFIFARSSRRPRPWWPLALCVVAGLVGIGITTNIWIDLESSDSSTSSEDDLFGDTDALVTVSWGLIVTLAASISLIFAATQNYLRRGVIVVGRPVAEGALSEAASGE